MVKSALRNGFVLSIAGAILLGAVLAYLIFGGGGSSNQATKQPSGNLIQVSLRRGIYGPLGLALEQPTSWLTSSQGTLLTLSSPDAGQASLTITDPAAAGNADKLRPAINSQLVKVFTPAKVIGQRRGPIGTTPAITTAILGTSRAKRQVLILSTAISSKYRTYSVQVIFKSLRPTQQSLLEVQHMLASIRFFAPTGA
jgi:hypothetical protein